MSSTSAIRKVSDRPGRVKLYRQAFVALLLIAVAATAAVLADRFALLGGPPAVLAPSPFDAERVSFFALGDIGRGVSAQRRVASSMEVVARDSGDVNFTLLLGDVFYKDGIASVKDSRWRRYFESVYDTPYLSGMPFYAALGNHDYRGNVEAHLTYARERLGSGRYRIPSRYYYQDFGRSDNGPLLRIFVADTKAVGSAATQQANAIRKVFSGRYGEPRWKIVAGHYPVRNFGIHGETHQLFAWLLPAMRDAEVHAYLSAHDHNQQAIAVEGEPFYVISGGGGHSLHKIPRKSQALRFAAMQYGFVKITVDEIALKVEFFDDSARLSYQLALTQPCLVNSNDCLPVSSSPTLVPHPPPKSGSTTRRNGIVDER